MYAMCPSGSSPVSKIVTMPGCSETLTRCLSLVKKTLAVFPLLLRVVGGERNCFDGYKPVNLGIAGFVDNSHRSPAKLADDLITSDTRTPARFHLAHRLLLRQNTPAYSLWRATKVGVFAAIAIRLRW